MSVIPVNLAIEDELSEAALRRLLSHADRGYAVGVAHGHSGFGYLRSTIAGWNSAAKGMPFIVLTDLDEYPCPTALISDWLHVPRNPNLLLRVAVREIESWLLADRENHARYLRISERWMPVDVEGLRDPKAALIDLARKSRSKEVKERIVPRRGSTAKQGPEYNACLSDFVQHHWNINAARQCSRSLGRTVARLGAFRPVWVKRK